MTSMYRQSAKCLGNCHEKTKPVCLHETWCLVIIQIINCDEGCKVKGKDALKEQVEGRVKEDISEEVESKLIPEE